MEAPLCCSILIVKRFNIKTIRVLLLFQALLSFSLVLGLLLEVILLVALLTKAFRIVNSVLVLAICGQFSCVDISVTNGAHTSRVVSFICVRAFSNFG